MSPPPWTLLHTHSPWHLMPFNLNGFSCVTFCIVRQTMNTSYFSPRDHFRWANRSLVIYLLFLIIRQNSWVDDDESTCDGESLQHHTPWNIHRSGSPSLLVPQFLPSTLFSHTKTASLQAMFSFQPNKARQTATMPKWFVLFPHDSWNRHCCPHSVC